ncbi:MAG: Lrp/AsnC ligand binding domain-containing protein [Bacteroidales bacterium]|nr:Lrp/AsnC ligand binding domain-containing protein [Bacteroidales bacterium]
MTNRFQLDSLDRRILSFLASNARTPYLEIARLCHVSGAAVHQRIQKMEEAGVIRGSQLLVHPNGLGFRTCAFIGIQINLSSSSTHEDVFRRISHVPEVVECHHITGKYSLLIKIYSRDNEHLKQIIVEKIQAIPEISFTETFISLEEGFERQLPVE